MVVVMVVEEKEAGGWLGDVQVQEGGEQPQTGGAREWR